MTPRQILEELSNNCFDCGSKRALPECSQCEKKLTALSQLREWLEGKKITEEMLERQMRGWGLYNQALDDVIGELK